MSLFIFQQFRKLLKALHSNETPRQLAAGVVFGFLLGLIPCNFLVTGSLVILLLSLKANIIIGFLSWLFFGLIAFLFDPVAHELGMFFLEKITWLKGLWTFLYHLPIIPFTHFNNTVMFGSLLMSVFLAWPVYILSFKLVVRYRKVWAPKLENHPLMKAIKATKPVMFISRILQD